MAKGLSQRGQFIAWVLLYGGAVWLMMSKAEESLASFVWGMALGIGAATAATGISLAPWTRRLAAVAIWFVGCWLLGLGLFWEEHVRRSHMIPDLLTNSLLTTLIAGFPALLALSVWLFKRPKASANTA